MLGRRVEISKKIFLGQLRDLYTSLSRQTSLNTANPQSASRQLFNQLIGPIAPLLEARGVTSLLIAADRGLQAVPFAALHDGSRFFGDRYGFSITPSLALTNLSSTNLSLTNLSSTVSTGQDLLVAGASKFDGLAPLPLVPQELQSINGKSTGSNIFLNRDFTADVLLEKIGDPSSELGFAGLAVQAGARSAAGTLWYVDDVASSAYFEQMYHYLNQGVPKAEALKLTRQAFIRGLVRLEGDQVLGPDGSVLLQKLNRVQQQRVQDGLGNPYFWAGIELVGSPW